MPWATPSGASSLTGRSRSISAVARSLADYFGSDVSSAPRHRAVTPPPKPPLLEQVPEAPDLGFLLVGDGDRTEAASPELLAPVVEAPGLLGEVAVQVLHEVGEGLGVPGHGEQVEVVGEEDVLDDVDGVEADAAGEEPVDDLDEITGGSQQVAALDGRTGDLDQLAWRHVAQGSPHAF
jgi:hypothetical protein